jgi:peptidyl-prolyl cis-trans isomerase D
MLQQIRDKITGWFAWVFLGAIAVVFIFWGIQFESTVTTAAAKVNGQEVSAEAVRRAWQDRQTELQQLTRDEIPPEIVRSEQARLVDQFIDRELLVQRAHESGYRVSDRELAETLRRIPALQVDGQFSRDRYAALLRQQGRSEHEFEREFRRDLETAQLQNGIAVSSFVTPRELERRIALEGESREISYTVIPAAKFAATSAPAPEAVAAYFEKNKLQFMTEETVGLQFLQLDLADIAAGVEVTEDGLRKFHADNAARAEVPERRRGSHILIESGSDDAAARKQAEDLLARIKAGEDFGKLAREYSADPGSKEAGGDLGWATRDTYVQPFADALFAMTQGEVRGPVKTQFGYHVVRLDGIEAPHARSFEEMRAELEPEYRNELAQNLFYERAQQLADEAFASLSELESVAQKLDLPLQTVERFTRRGGGPFGDDRKVIDAAFSQTVLQDRQNSPAIQVADDRVVVLRVTGHQPSQQRPLEAVRDEIVARLGEESTRAAAAKAAAELAQRLNAGDQFAAAAAAVGGSAPTPVQPVTRAGPVNEGAAPVSPELVKAVFQAPRPAAAGKVSAGSATLASGDQVVFVISGVQSGKPEGEPAVLSQRIQAMAAQRALAEFGGYLDDLRRSAKITRNETLFAAE